MRILYFTRAAPPEKLIAGFRAAGHVVDIGDVASLGGGADQAYPEDTWLVIDESALPDFGPHSGELRNRRAAALIRETPAAIPAFLPALRRIIVTSSAVAERLRTTGALDVDRIRVIAPGVDPAPRSPGSGDHGCNILTIDQPPEADALLLKALARLFDLEWSLTILGTHDARRAELAATLGIGGRLRHTAGEAPAWHGADLFVHTCPWRGEPPGAVGAALKRGVPVIVTGTDASLVPALAGLVCPPDDRDQISRAMRRLIFDPALRRSYADAAFAAGAKLPGWPTQAAALANALA